LRRQRDRPLEHSLARCGRDPRTELDDAADPVGLACRPAGGGDYAAGMSGVRVRMAPSPTGFLHIGGVRTFLFNLLFARGRNGESLLRVENTHTSPEGAAATEPIQRSLAWLGIDWDRPAPFP